MTISPAPSSKVNFQIERLTLHGYSAAERSRFIRALQTELTAVATAVAATATGPTWRSAPAQIPRLNAGTAAAGSTPEAAALNVATSVGAALSNRGASRP